MTGGSDVDDIGVVGVDDNAPHLTRFLEPHELPGLPGVGGFVDAVAPEGGGVVGFARSYPDDIRIGGGDGHGANGHRSIHGVKYR